MKKKQMILFSIMLFILVAVIGVARFFLFPPVPTGYLTNQSYRSGYLYHAYVPSSYKHNNELPLFVVLHGGTQTADQIAVTSKMNDLAEEYHFAVLYPQQSTSANPSYYWNWFYAVNQQRGNGELGVIIGMIERFRTTYSIQSDQIYAAGLSAGACTALSLGIAYSDVISGVALASGVGYGVADTVNSAYSVMDGIFPSLETAVTKAYQAMEEKHLLKTLVFHGTNDARVDVSNAHYIISQIAALNDLVDDGLDNDSMVDLPSEETPFEPSGMRSYTRYRYTDLNDEIIMEKYIINGMEHRWSGGDSNGTYSDPLGPDMSSIMVKFFLGLEE